MATLLVLFDLKIICSNIGISNEKPGKFGTKLHASVLYTSRRFLSDFHHGSDFLMQSVAAASLQLLCSLVPLSYCLADSRSLDILVHAPNWHRFSQKRDIFVFMMSFLFMLCRNIHAPPMGRLTAAARVVGDSSSSSFP